MANVWRYVLPPLHRGGTCFCPRDGVLDYTFRYKVVGVCKNRDTIAGEPASAGQPTPGCTKLSWWLQSCPGVEGGCIYRPVGNCAILCYRGLRVDDEINFIYFQEPFIAGGIESCIMFDT